MIPARRMRILEACPNVYQLHGGSGGKRPRETLGKPTDLKCWIRNTEPHVERSTG